ncbi:MAG: sigma-54-dependent Fis family transcriptional regulator [bacterium]|nr:sigma-54-dependent Fis family transcriptional regulator [bacterium]MCP4800659.1 sigma-54-dependent Fis family transcriptional regulator [bacterium]
MANILVVDDEKRNVELLRLRLEGQGHSVTGCHDGASALKLFGEQAFDIVLTDLKMEPVDGMAVIEGVKKDSPDTPVIMLTAYADWKTAVGAMETGAFTYLKKPWEFDEVNHAVNRALDTTSQRRSTNALKQEVKHISGSRTLLGSSETMQKMLNLIAKVGPTDATVMIRGESGSGKELVARAVHDSSNRVKKPFVAVNCAAISGTLLESELFGYRKGAFTGADSDREGLFEAANGGTLFLDEIGEAGMDVQAKLLRVLEEKKINRVGDPREREVDVRVIAATNRPLEDAITEGLFREDLYYRLVVFPVDVPALRDRLDDLQELSTHFLDGGKIPVAALKRMRSYGWPGNVRELRNVIERAKILASGSVADQDILLDVRASGPSEKTGDLNLEINEKKLIETALKRANGNKTAASEMLGITRRTLYSRIKLLDLDL